MEYSLSQQDMKSAKLNHSPTFENLPLNFTFCFMDIGKPKHAIQKS